MLIILLTFTFLLSRPAVVLELSGDTSARLYNAATTPDLYRIVMNKGNSQDLYFSLDNSFLLNGPTEGDTKAIELKNGTLILNHTDIDIGLSTGGADFNIPATSALVDFSRVEPMSRVDDRRYSSGR